MKKIQVIIITLFIMASLGGGYYLLFGSEKQTTITDHKMNGIIRSGGSGTGIGPWQSIVKDFELENPGIKVNFASSVGTAGAIKDTFSGILELATTARPPTDEEMSLTPVVYHKIAKDIVVIATNPDVTISNLTSRQIQDIYSGKITNWQEIGGPDLEIRVLGRTEDETPTQVMRTGVLSSVHFADNVQIMAKSGDMAVGIIKFNGAIGYSNIGKMIETGEKYNAISIDGIAPSESNAESGAYTYIMEIGAVTKTTPAGAVKKFIDFAHSEIGKSAIKSAGYIPF